MVLFIHHTFLCQFHMVFYSSATKDLMPGALCLICHYFELYQYKYFGDSFLLQTNSKQCKVYMYEKKSFYLLNDPCVYTSLYVYIISPIYKHPHSNFIKISLFFSETKITGFYYFYFPTDC